MKLKGLMISIILFLSTLCFLSGCATTRDQSFYDNLGLKGEIVKEKRSDHGHKYPDVKVAGDFHVIRYLDRKSGEAGIRILDNYEKRYHINVEKIRARATAEGKDPELLWLIGKNYKTTKNYRGEQELIGASLFTSKFDWPKREHKVSLEVWIPLPDGKIYELEFEFKEEKPTPAHSGKQNPAGF